MSPRAPLTFEQISFTGMRDSLDPTTAEPRKALLLQNVYPVDTFLGAAVIGRPGVQQMGAQLGAIAARRVQRIYQFTKQDGTEYTVGFVGGHMYTYNWLTSVWTEVALGGGVVLDTAARVFCVTFANAMVVNDGVNRPWMWDGAAFTVLGNAPIAYGQPVVYYNKLFFIRLATLQDILWSEEGQPNTGYDVGGYNNAWTVAQTSQRPMYALFATNEALYVFRDRSITAISGAVTPDFKSSGTREGVSETIGTTSPDGLTYHEGVIYFIDADGYPHALPVGGREVPLWGDLRETLSRVPRALLNKVVACAYPACELVLIGLAEVSTFTESVTHIAIDTRTQQIAGLWRGWTSAALDLVKNADGVPTVVHGSINGYVYEHGNPDGVLWQDALNVADGDVTAIEHIVAGTPMGYSIPVDKHFVRWDGVFRILTDLDFTIDYETPRGQSTPLAVHLDGAFALWDIDQWDVAKWATVNLERHQQVGWSGDGRWVRPRVTHKQGAQRFGMLGQRVTAVPIGPYPRVP